MNDVPSTPPKKFPKVLSPAALSQNADYHRAIWHLEVPNDVTLDDIVKPGYWANHHRILKRGALIDVLTEDYEMDVQLRVLGTEVGMVFVRVAQVRQMPGDAEDDAVAQDNASEAPAAALEIPHGYTVRFLPHTKYQAAFGGEVVSQDHDTKAEAIEAAIDHATRAGRLEAAA